MAKKKFKYSSVMLIDDSDIDNFINQKMIEGYAFSERTYVHTCSKSALEFFVNIKAMELTEKELLPQVIFLDINMPMMDGFQFLDNFQNIKKDTFNCKIYILTSSINPSDIVKSGKSPLITAFINKPLTKELLESI